MNWKYPSIIVLAALALAIWLLSSAPFNPEFYSREKIRNNLFEIQSIDTMKYSLSPALARRMSRLERPMTMNLCQCSRAGFDRLALTVFRYGFAEIFPGGEGGFGIPKTAAQNIT